MPPHRKVLSEDILFVKGLRDAEVRVADALCVLIRQAGGAPFVGFQLNNLYNTLGDYDKKSFDGSNANSLIGVFKKRVNNVVDFCYDFELGVNGCLVSFFCVTSRCWRTTSYLVTWLFFTQLIEQMSMV